jgi:hypothetical protein
LSREPPSTSSIPRFSSDFARKSPKRLTTIVSDSRIPFTVNAYQSISLMIFMGMTLSVCRLLLLAKALSMTDLRRSTELQRSTDDAIQAMPLAQHGRAGIVSSCFLFPGVVPPIPHESMYRQ